MVDSSIAIHEHLVRYLGPDGARFGGAFDIPLLMVAEDPTLRRQFLQAMPGEPDPVSWWDQLDVQDEDIQSPGMGQADLPWQH